MRNSIPIRWWALLSGLTGTAANTFLVLFYVTARPWLENGSSGWFGRANDTLVVLQYLTLIPVVIGLGRLMGDDAPARAWTRIGLATSSLLVVLQILLLTRLLPFAIQVVPAALCVVISILWAGGISRVGARCGTLPQWLARFGRVLAIAVPAGAVVFAVVFVMALVTRIPGLWVVGALPGAMFFFLFPIWVLALATVGPDAHGRLEPTPPRKRNAEGLVS